jgi:tetratricopeptide (TPR) repeat protein
MHDPDPAGTTRLQRLQAYLIEDPRNAELLLATCEAAIESGAHACAQACIESARGLNLPWPPWARRVARLAIARLDWPTALQALREVQAVEGSSAGLALDLSLAHFQCGDMDGARTELAPWITLDRSADDPGEAQAPMQVLWLRATHRRGLAAEATDWARRQREQASLQPLAAGVASLAAVDAGEFTLAAELAQDALGADAVTPEALVALASVALGRRDAGLATDLLQRALATCPDDGRTWSLIGLLHLQGRELAQAQDCFRQALATMPGHIGTWHGLGWACLLQGDRASAAEAFDRALQLDRNFAESHGAVGLVLMLSGRAAQAHRHFDLADRLDRSNVTGRYARALAAGDAADAQALQALADRLLDRPGLFGGNLRDEFAARAH